MASRDKNSANKRTVRPLWAIVYLIRFCIVARACHAIMVVTSVVRRSVWPAPGGSVAGSSFTWIIIAPSLYLLDEHGNTPIVWVLLSASGLPSKLIFMVVPEALPISRRCLRTCALRTAPMDLTSISWGFEICPMKALVLFLGLVPVSCRDLRLVKSQRSGWPCRGMIKAHPGSVDHVGGGATSYNAWQFPKLHGWLGTAGQ